MRLRHLVPLLTAAALAVPATAAVQAAPVRPAVTAQRADGLTTHVLVISVDGLNPAGLRTLGAGRLPSFYRLIDDGASTLNARTEVERTETLPDHVGMVTGRRVAANRGGHGVTWNDGRDRTVQQGAGHPVASVFTQVHAASGSTAVFASKAKFSIFERSWPGAIDRSLTVDDEARVVKAARADLRTHQRAFTFLHLARVDRAGHRDGFLSAGYLSALRKVDREIGSVLNTIEATPALADTIVILTSDHGGAKGAHNHTNPRVPDNYIVPFVVWGRDISTRDLYQINPDYLDPVRRRPGYDANRQPVRNGDVANLALGLLGLGPVPGSELDAEQDLDIVY